MCPVGGLYLAASGQSLQYSSNAVGYFDLPGGNWLVLQKFDTNGNSIWGQRLAMGNITTHTEITSTHYRGDGYVYLLFCMLSVM